MNSFRRSPNPTANMPNRSFLNVEPFVYTHEGPEGIEGKLRILPVNHSRALRTGLDLLTQRPLALLGISPGNGFFNQKRIEIGICGMAHLFGEVTIVIPDSIATHTFRALGYGEEKVRAKARTEGQKIRNRCLRAVERAQLLNPSARLRILDWESDIASLPGYWNAYAQVCKLFDTNNQFQQDVLDKGFSLLRGKLSADAITPATVRECVEYLLKEFAYFKLCRVACGRDLIMPYHQDAALAHGFCDGRYQEPLPGVGWLIYDIELFGESE
ncbi:tRNA-dependent cyclodipeptide synthase [Spirosoma endbachense]|uniref:Cyclodipeptide synthase n=1 Tax=Spirosoma endbachense TaxID=2666025 RepID=A0A6P1W5W8_9BACT|nr:tRNA-dependent cyclodipeptide synthase [Spirosoma endbachense]QHV99437.1 tRNA-dependent cyclodipeptide synthase [Spirosoma endbachense]